MDTIETYSTGGVPTVDEADSCCRFDPENRRVSGRSRVRLFPVINTVLLLAMAVFCVLPFVNILALSVSESHAVMANSVGLWPIGFNLKSYEFAIKSGAFLRAFWISVQRVCIGVTINMVIVTMVAYPLAKERKRFPAGTVYAWYFLLTTLVSAGLIPWYMTIRFTGLLNSFLALVLPSAVPVFSIIVLLNFFRRLPKELEESAYIDGAGEWTTLVRVYIPLSKPALATLTLYSTVFHWNSWFDGLILMNDPARYPLQSFLRTVIINPETFFQSAAALADYNVFLSFVNARTARAAQIFIAALPMLLVYPFLQKYFTKGLVLGSVKG